MKKPYENPEEFKDQADELIGIQWFIEYIEAQGYTLDEYFEIVATPKYQETLTITQLEQQFFLGNR